MGELGSLRNSFICLTGIDGSGKTTQSHNIIEAFRLQKIRVRYTYLRSPHFFSKPLMGLSRILGITEFITDSNGKPVRGFHHFYRYNFLSYLVLWFQALDLHFYTLKEIRIPRLFGWTVVCDRYVADTLVDMIVETKRYNMVDSLVWRFFMSAYPKDTMLVVLTGNKDLIKSRKDDIKFDPWFEKKNHLFFFMIKRLKSFSPIYLNTTRFDIDQTFSRITSKLVEKEKVEPRKWSKSLRYFFFQGFFYSDTTEKIYRLGLLISLTLFFVLYISWISNLSIHFVMSISFFTSILFSFVFNSSFWATISCDLKFSTPIGRFAMYDYLFKLSNRIESNNFIDCYFAFGSISRGNFHNESDLDMLFVRKKGFINMMKGILFLQYERLLNLFSKMPVELWMADSHAFVNTIRKDESVVIIYAIDDKLENYFHSTQTIKSSIINNGDQNLFDF